MLDFGRVLRKKVAHSPLGESMQFADGNDSISIEIGGALQEGSLESQFKALEASSVDDQLEALKRKMALTAGKSEDPKQLGSGNAKAPPEEPSADDMKAAEIDAQLEELKKKLSG